MAKTRYSAAALIEHLARGMALLGGGVLVIMALMATCSIVGRSLLSVGLHPVPGDFELIEAGTAFVVTAFLPWCHLHRGHASVGVLTDRFSPSINLIVDFVSDTLLALVAVFLTWRHGLGLIDRFTYGDTTFILRFPLWWAYAMAMIGLVVWVVVGTFASFRSFNQLRHPANVSKGQRS